MKAYEVQSHAGIDALVQIDQPDPVPGYGQVLVQMKAAALNYRDLITANANERFPFVPLSDGAGEVVAVGEGVERVRVGDRVAGTFFQDWSSGRITRQSMKSALGGALDGVLSEYRVFHETGVVQLPDHLAYEEGATLPCAALTAWHALVTQGRLATGETVLLLGTGGVSIFALQFARMHGARVIITSSSDAKLERAIALGADETINYQTTPDWDKAVYDLTDRVGADHIIEVGGSGTLERSLRAVRVGGRVNLIGVLTGFNIQVDPTQILFKSVAVQGIYVGSREMFEAMNRAIAFHQMRPVIDRIFPFDAAPEAYRYLQSGIHVGKIVIRY